MGYDSALWAVGAGDMQLARFLLRRGRRCHTNDGEPYRLMEAARRAIMPEASCCWVDQQQKAQTALLLVAAAAGHIEVIESCSWGSRVALQIMPVKPSQVAQRSDQPRVISFLSDDDVDKVPIVGPRHRFQHWRSSRGMPVRCMGASNRRCGFLILALTNELQNGPGHVQ